MKRVLVALVCLGVTLAGTTSCKKSPEARKAEAMERGKKLSEQKDYARAVLEFRNAAQAAPKDAEVQYQLAMALLGSGDVTGGYFGLLKATELNPGHAAAQVRLSELLTVTNNPELLKHAAARMNKLLAAKPADPEALSTLAFTELQLGETKEAEEHLSRAVETGPTNVKAAVGLAHVRLTQGKPAEAEQILRRVTEQKPPVAMAHTVMGQFYASQKRDDEARREFARALSIDPSSIIALQYLGALHHRNNQLAEADGIYKRLAALPDKRYRSVHAVYLYQNGKREEALKELEQLVAADRTDRPTRRRLVSAYLLLNRVADAERVLAATLKENARDTDALLLRSQLLIDSGKYADAQNDLAQVINFEPNSAEAHYLLARVHAARGNASSRRQELGEAVRLDPALLRARLEYARVLIAANAAQTALEVLDKTPQWQKQHPVVAVERNWVLAALGRKDEMRQSVETALKTMRSVELMIQDALLKLDAGNFAAARATLEEVLKSRPEDARSLDLLAQSYATQGQTAAAVKRVREQAAAYPKSAQVQLVLASWLQRSGAVPEARKAYETAKTVDRNLWQADLALAALDLAEQNGASAKARVEPLLAHAQAGNSARVLLAMAEEKNHNAAKAVEEYRKVVEQQPENVVALNNLAFMLADTESSRDEALRYAERAKALAGDNPAIDDTLGWILYRKGQHARALPLLENAVKKQPNVSRHAHLAMVYAAHGDKNKGFAQLEAALKLGGASHPQVQEAQRALALAR